MQTRIRSRPARQDFLASFYTSPDLAGALSTWALDGACRPILDPSFGGCSFLGSSVAALDYLGAENPGSFVWGVDVDRAALGHARRMISLGVPEENIIFKDFFRLSPSELPKFGAVVGNPPYIRASRIGRERRARAALALAENGISIDGRASYWAYFLLHAMTFLAQDARLAFVLPRSVLQADYARDAIERVIAGFGVVRFLSLRERVFAGIDERTVLLLCDGFGSGPAQVLFEEVSTVSEALQAIGGHDEKSGSSEPISWKLSLLTVEEREAWQQFVDHERSIVLGDIARIRLGVVTGANAFFVRRSSERGPSASSKNLWRPVVSRGAQIKGLRFVEDDLQDLHDADAPAYLLDLARSKRIPKGVGAWIEEAEAAQIHLRYKCCKRDPWYVLRDTAKPDAFLRYMGSMPGNIVLNATSATATNSIHRMEWISRVASRAVSVGSCTSAFALAVELLGRDYGGGVLKIEPLPAQLLPVPLVHGAGNLMPSLDRSLRKGDRIATTERADAEVLVKGLGLSRRAATAMAAAARRLAERRQAR